MCIRRLILCARRLILYIRRLMLCIRKSWFHRDQSYLNFSWHNLHIDVHFIVIVIIIQQHRYHIWKTDNFIFYVAFDLTDTQALNELASIINSFIVFTPFTLKVFEFFLKSLFLYNICPVGWKMLLYELSLLSYQLLNFRHKYFIKMKLLINHLCLIICLKDFSTLSCWSIHLYRYYCWNFTIKFIKKIRSYNLDQLHCVDYL